MVSNLNGANTPYGNRMTVVDVVVWNSDGSHRLRRNGRDLRVDIDENVEVGSAEFLRAITKQLDMDVALLRVGTGDTVEVELLAPGDVAGHGFWWQPGEMHPPGDERPPWHRPGWLNATVRAVDRTLTERGLTRTGPARQVRHTSVTGMFRLETDRFPLWLKAVLPIFAHEGAVAKWLYSIAPGRVPDVFAHTPEWWLAREFPERAPRPTSDFLDVLADLQIASISRTHELRAVGCPDRSSPVLPVAVASVARSSDLLHTGLRRALRKVLPKLDRVTERIGALGIPDTVVHGDLTARNVLWTGHDWLLFDWTDACIAHPFVDLAVALEEDGDSARRTAAYGYRWRSVLPKEKIVAGLESAPVLGAAHQIVTYQSILESFERTGGDPQGGHEMVRLLHHWTARLVELL